MRPAISRSQAWRYLVGALLCLAAPARAATDESAHLQLFVAVPTVASTPTELRVERVELVGQIETYAFSAARPVLVSEELRGRVTLFVDAAFAADVIDSVRVVWAGASVEVDRAPTTLPLAGTSTSLALGRRIEAGTAAVFHLHWNPDATDPTRAAWAPELRLEEPEVPAVAAMLFVSQEGSGTVAVVDRRSGVVVDAIVTSGAPRGLAWSSAQQRLFVAVAGRDEVAVIDPGQSRVARRVPLEVGDDPTRLLLSADGTRLVVLCPGRDVLVVLSTASLQEIGRVLLDPGVLSMVEQPSTGRVFVSATQGRRIAVVDPKQLQVVRTLERADAPGELAWLGDDEGLVIASRHDRSLEEVDPATGAQRSSMNLCGTVTGLAHQSRTDRLIAVVDLCREVVFLRPVRALEVGSVRLESAGGLPTLDPEDRMLFVPLPHENAVLSIHTSHVRDLRRIETAARPYQIVVP